MICDEDDENADGEDVGMMVHAHQPHPDHPTSLSRHPQFVHDRLSTSKSL